MRRRNRRSFGRGHQARRAGDRGGLRQRAGDMRHRRGCWPLRPCAGDRLVAEHGRPDRHGPAPRPAMAGWRLLERAPTTSGEEGGFDAAVCALGLMYLPDPGEAVASMARATRPGGRVVATVWGERRNCGWAELFPIVDARVARKSVRSSSPVERPALCKRDFEQDRSHRRRGTSPARGSGISGRADDAVGHASKADRSRSPSSASRPRRWRKRGRIPGVP